CVPADGRATRRAAQAGARRRGGTSEGLGASRESGRGRSQDREGLRPVRRGRPGQRGGGPGGPRGGAGRGPRRSEAGPAAEAVEMPRTDEQGVTAEGRELPVVEPT